MRNLRNDLLLQHLRTLAKFAKDPDCRQSAQAEEAAAWVEQNLGFDGEPHSEAQESAKLNIGIPPDSGLNAYAAHVVEQGTAAGDMDYYPHLGYVVVSSHRQSDWKRSAERDGIKSAWNGDKAGYLAIPEEVIMSMAEIVITQRQLSDVADAIKAGKPVFPNLHEGTDAEDKTGDMPGHDYKNWSDVERSRSTAILTITSGSRYLNGSMTKHQHWMSIAVHGPDGRELVEFAMTPEQFAQLLVSRTTVPCTVTDYWSLGSDSVRLRERVYDPEPVMDRMEQRLKDSIKKQDEDFLALINKLKDRPAKAMSPTELKQLLHDLQIIYGHRQSGVTFVVGQAVEEASTLAESAMGRVLLSQMHGGDGRLAVETIVKSFVSTKRLPAPKPEPVPPIDPKYHHPRNDHNGDGPCLACAPE